MRRGNYSTLVVFLFLSPYSFIHSFNYYYYFFFFFLITLNLVTSEKLKKKNIVAGWQADLLCEHLVSVWTFFSCGVNTWCWWAYLRLAYSRLYISVINTYIICLNHTTKCQFRYWGVVVICSQMWMCCVRNWLKRPQNCHLTLWSWKRYPSFYTHLTTLEREKEQRQTTLTIVRLAETLREGDYIKTRKTGCQDNVKKL